MGGGGESRVRSVSTSSANGTYFYFPLFFFFFLGREFIFPSLSFFLFHGWLDRVNGPGPENIEIRRGEELKLALSLKHCLIFFLFNKLLILF